MQIRATIKLFHKDQVLERLPSSNIGVVVTRRASSVA